MTPLLIATRKPDHRRQSRPMLTSQFSINGSVFVGAKQTIPYQMMLIWSMHLSDTTCIWYAFKRFANNQLSFLCFSSLVSVSLFFWIFNNRSCYDNARLGYFTEPFRERERKFHFHFKFLRRVALQQVLIFKGPIRKYTFLIGPWVRIAHPIAIRRAQPFSRRLFCYTGSKSTDRVASLK